MSAVESICLTMDSGSCGVSTNGYIDGAHSDDF